MKHALIFLLWVAIFSTLILPASAATGEQECQSKKNTAIGNYAKCRHKALFLHRTASRHASAKACEATFRKEWRKIVSEATSAGAVCFDAPLESADFDVYIRNRTNTIAALLGKSSKSKVTAQQVCRRIKSVEAGDYTACRLEAEAALARKTDFARYNSSISLCENEFSRGWQKIISETKRRRKKCLDHRLAKNEYKSIIDEYTTRVASVLAGNDELKAVSLVVTGSPLTLISGGPAKTLTVTNTSAKATLTAIKAKFEGTILEGKVFESGNTCASLQPNASCTLTFTPGNSVLSSTDFLIQGTGSLAVVASIAIEASETPTPTATATPTPSLTPTPSPSPSPTPTPTPTPSLTPTPTPSPVTLNVSGSPLQLTVNGSTGILTITNASATTAALNITSDFTATALDGNVTETGNTCANVSPMASCTLTYTPGSTVVAATSFNIQGSNTSGLSASIQIISGSTLTAVNATTGPAAGGAGVTLTGTGLTGATSVTFGGIAATSVNVINSTTVTAVTPAHAAGAVDVVINTPAGGATLTSGYTYVATAIGQAAAGGTIACLNGGLNNLIASTADNGLTIEWGGSGTAIGAGAQSTTDGASNTTSIVSALGANGGVPYAAQICSNYEVDSQGNTPCQAGNTCYNDWFLPAGDNATVSGQLNCLYSNRVAIGGFLSGFYWSSTEFSANPSFSAWLQNFATSVQLGNLKPNTMIVRCVRAFTP